MLRFAAALFIMGVFTNTLAYDSDNKSILLHNVSDSLTVNIQSPILSNSNNESGIVTLAPNATYRLNYNNMDLVIADNYLSASANSYDSICVNYFFYGQNSNMDIYLGLDSSGKVRLMCHAW